MGTPYETRVAWYPTTSPGDTAPLEAFLDDLPLPRLRRLLVLGKTEGTASANDFGRDFALAALGQSLAARGGGDLVARATVIMSMGTEGIATPGLTLLAALDGAPAPGLALGAARSAPLQPDQVTGPDHVEAVIAATEAARAEAGLHPDEVVLVLVKSPVLTPERAALLPRATRQRAASTAASRAVAALAVGVALGEVPPERIEAALAGDDDAHARRCMASSGTETLAVEVAVLGNRGTGGVRTIHGAVLGDLIDRRAVVQCLRQAGLAFDADGVLVDAARVPAAFFKAGSTTDGRMRGLRTTVASSEVAPDKQLRAAASGFVAGLLGHTRTFISGGAEGQVPPGGSLFACIVEADG
ncbi:MAG: cyanuric acid amidohydrolase [Geminicoccaceae bacterium]|nr:MAG: cyanuric acid amidohydrolase [Geminicoccaceae bacterium]